MITVGYFCTGGYTEVGGIHNFLKKVNPKINWIRCFPAVDKMNLKKGRLSSTPVREHSGITGEVLVEKMFERLSHPGFEKNKFDLILLIDDKDCRFKQEGEAETWIRQLHKQIVGIIRKNIKFDVLFASPEIETWFIADWEFGFAKEYPSYEFNIREILKKEVLQSYWDNIEDYGGSHVNGSCENKLSEKIQEIVIDVTNERYSKRMNGVSMLNRVRPEEIAKKCRICFAPTFRLLQRLGK